MREKGVGRRVHVLNSGRSKGGKQRTNKCTTEKLQRKRTKSKRMVKREERKQCGNARERDGSRAVQLDEHDRRRAEQKEKKMAKDSLEDELREHVASKRLKRHSMPDLD